MAERADSLDTLAIGAFYGKFGLRVLPGRNKGQRDEITYRCATRSGIARPVREPKQVLAEPVRADRVEQCGRS